MSRRKTQNQSKSIIEELGKRSQGCQEFVRKSLLSEKIEHRELRQALEHYFSYWNDFTHPGIFSIALEAVEGNPAKQIEAQAAMAMLAAAFDIHDDIVDDSKTKHHCSTVFGKYGKDIALLLGNAFMIDGFTLMGKVACRLPPERSNDIFYILKTSFFVVGNAHASELRLKRRLEASPEEYLEILEKKAASVEADMHIAAIFGGGSRKEVEALARYGRILGTLATLREEFVDIFEIEELNQRIKAEAFPIPVLYALQDKDSREKIEKIIEKGELTSKDIDGLLDVVLSSKPVARLRKYMQDLVTEASKQTDIVRNKTTGILLRRIAANTLEDL
ncbi:MAG: class 1 isoprenoid biosynthesis enzyme [Candidatus Bathyarchaeia archaeon]|jgi:geranylgeranyl pyrophosphate synthase